MRVRELKGGEMNKLMFECEEEEKEKGVYKVDEQTSLVYKGLGGVY